MTPGLISSKKSGNQMSNQVNMAVPTASLSAVIKNMPESYQQLLFSELNPFCDFRNKFILGTIVQAYPIVHGRRNTYLRKFLLTDALSQEVESSKQKLSVFLFDNFAQECETVKEGDFLGMSDFLVENLTLASQNHELMPIQVCLNSEDLETRDSQDRQMWIIRKKPAPPIENKRKRENSVSPLKNMPKKVATKQIGPVEESPTRSYHYSSINELPLNSSDDQYFSIYGIVDDCHLRTHPGSHSQSLELQLSDTTRSKFCCTIYCKKDDGSFPDVQLGDIVRIHRLKVLTVRGEVRGKCISHKFIVVFEKDNQELQPKSTARTFVYTDDDKEKVKALFQWAELKNGPKLICDLKPEENISLIVQVIGVYISKRVDCVTLKIWDGTRNNNCENSHLNLDSEKIVSSLFNVAKPYYITLFVYGNYCLAAGQLEPGQYVLVQNAHLTSSPNTVGFQFRLIIPAMRKAGRGVFVLSNEDSRVQDLKCRLDQLTEENTVEKERQSCNENDESFFLNSDISTSQIKNAVDVHPHSSPICQLPIPDNENPVISIVNAAVRPGQSTQEFGGIYAEIGEKRKAAIEASEEDNGNKQASKRQKASTDECAESLSKSKGILETATSESPQPLISEALNQLQIVPGNTSHHVFGTSETASCQQFSLPWAEKQTQIAVLGTENQTQLAVPGAENQAQLAVPVVENQSQFAVPEARKQLQVVKETGKQTGLPISEDVNHPHSSTSETVNQVKHTEFECSQFSQLLQTQEIFTSLGNTQDSWWKNVADSLSVTDGHSQVKPSPLSEVVEFPAPYKFRVIAVALHFKPETESMNQLIRLYCPSCHYISKDATPDLEVHHFNNNLPMYYCPECRRTCRTEGRLLEYTFLISFNLHDGTGPELYEAFLWRHNAVKFFKGILPAEALQNKSVAKSILEMLWEVCPNSRPLGTDGNSKWKFYPTLDCCIMSYTAGGLTRYQIFDTILN